MEARLREETIYCMEVNLTNDETERYLTNWDLTNTTYLAEAPPTHDSRGHQTTQYARPWTASYIHFHYRTCQTEPYYYDQDMGILLQAPPEDNQCRLAPITLTPYHYLQRLPRDPLAEDLLKLNYAELLQLQREIIEHNKAGNNFYYHTMTGEALNLPAYNDIQALNSGADDLVRAHLPQSSHSSIYVRRHAEDGFDRTPKALEEELHRDRLTDSADYTHHIYRHYECSMDTEPSQHGRTLDSSFRRQQQWRYRHLRQFLPRNRIAWTFFPGTQERQVTLLPQSHRRPRMISRRLRFIAHRYNQGQNRLYQSIRLQETFNNRSYHYTPYELYHDVEDYEHRNEVPSPDLYVTETTWRPNYNHGPQLRWAETHSYVKYTTEPDPRTHRTRDIYISTADYYGHVYSYPHRNFDRTYELQRWELRWGIAGHNFFIDGPEPPLRRHQPWAHTHYTWRPVTPTETVRNQYHYFLGDDDTSADSDNDDDPMGTDNNNLAHDAPINIPLPENRCPDTTGQNSHVGRQIQQIYMQYTVEDGPQSLRALAAYEGSGTAAAAA